MSDYGEDYEYAAEKLPNTIVRLKNGNPVYVDLIDVRGKLCLVKPLNNLNDMKRVKLQDLDLRSPPLGFVNYRDKAVYVMRIPKRRDWRQGLRGANCIVDNNRFTLENLLATTGLYNCIVGKYPTIDSIIKKSKRVKKLELKIAWARHWALDTHNRVSYKNWGEVGTLEAGGKDISFDNGFSFLRESFEESVG